MVKKIKTKNQNKELTVFSDENKEEEIFTLMDENDLEEFKKDADIILSFEF